ncbi:MAG: alpha/beta hydrolase, partial [SAR202 cluster bacterium]|nr:alpha/beta hydrolase [SAR202 cluster bacterium]
MYANVNGTTIAYDTTGQGPPLLLLHGYPQTRRMWRKVTPALARRFTVVAMDLRGCGDSAKPHEESGYDKRTMAEDALALMRHLGQTRFLVVGHDRGARAARRLAADHPDALTGAALLDIMPMEWVFSQGQGGYARRYWHWYFMLQRGIAEAMLHAAPREYVLSFFRRSHVPLDPADVEHYV